MSDSLTYFQGHWSHLLLKTTGFLTGADTSLATELYEFEVWAVVKWKDRQSIDDTCQQMTKEKGGSPGFL